MTIPREPAFSRDEYLARIEKVCQRLGQAGFDGLLLFSTANITYLTGMDTENLFDFQCLVLAADRRLQHIILDFELGRFLNSSWITEPIQYTAFQDPLEVVASVAHDLGLTPGRLAVETGVGGISPQTYLDLSRKLDRASLGAAEGIVERVRLVKSSAEIDHMRAAAQLTDTGVRAGFKAIRAGVADYEIAAAITQAMYQAGSETVCWGPIVAAGYRSGLAHSSFNGYHVQPGDNVFLELTGQHRRYVAPLMRTAFLGTPPEEVRIAAETSAAALSTILEKARAGVPASEVATAAGQIIQRVRDRVVFHDNFGYPVGLGYPPSWLERLGFFIRTNNPEPLEQNMVFHLPMSLRMLGRWGTCLSQTMVVTHQGGEPLAQTPARLEIMA
ncbi:MAG: aminopeptidase P family protein [Chloroflexi bacterium]|nr:aminopeptidase P family protein [Chloroflexota bacterium]